MITKSPAARMQMIMDMYQSPEYDIDTGELIGYKLTGLITKEQMLELLNFPTKIFNKQVISLKYLKSLGLKKYVKNKSK